MQFFPNPDQWAKRIRRLRLLGREDSENSSRAEKWFVIGSESVREKGDDLMRETLFIPYPFQELIFKWS